MRLEQLQYISEVAQCHSLSKAAKRLHISQPCLSNAISNLEKEMGVKLFHRTSKGTIPTIMGEEVINIARSILADLDHLDDFARKNQRIKDDLHIAAAPAICNSHILDICTLLKDEIPHLSLYVHEIRPEEVLDSLRKRLFSVCIINRIDQFQPLQEEEYFKLNYQAKPLFQDKMMIFASTKSPLRHIKDLTIAQVLAQYRTISQITNRSLLNHYHKHPIL